MAKMGPTRRFDADGGAKIDIIRETVFRALIFPPVQIFGLPVFKRTLKTLVPNQINVIGNSLVVVNVSHVTTPFLLKTMF